MQESRRTSSSSSSHRHLSGRKRYVHSFFRQTRMSRSIRRFAAAASRCVCVCACRSSLPFTIYNHTRTHPAQPDRGRVSDEGKLKPKRRARGKGRLNTFRFFPLHHQPTPGGGCVLCCTANGGKCSPSFVVVVVVVLFSHPPGKGVIFYPAM